MASTINQGNVSSLNEILGRSGYTTESIDQLISNNVTLDQLMGKNPEIARMVEDYLRVVGERLSQMTDRMWEADFRAGPAVLDHPNAYKEHYVDYSEGTLWKDRVPAKVFDNLQEYGPQIGLNEEEIRIVEWVMLQNQFDLYKNIQGYNGLSNPSPVDPNQGKGTQSNPVQPQTNEANSTTVMGKGMSTESSQGNAVVGKNLSAPPGYPGATPGTNAQSGNTQSNSVYDGVAQSVEGNPAAGWVNMALEQGQDANLLAAQVAARLDARRSQRDSIRAALNNLDLNTPEGKKQWQLLMAQMEELQGSDRIDMDSLQNIAKARAQMIEFVKTMIEQGFKTSESIIRNIGR